MEEKELCEIVVVGCGSGAFELDKIRGSHADVVYFDEFQIRNCHEGYPELDVGSVARIQKYSKGKGKGRGSACWNKKNRGY